MSQLNETQKAKGKGCLGFSAEEIRKLSTGGDGGKLSTGGDGGNLKSRRNTHRYVYLVETPTATFMRYFA